MSTKNIIRILGICIAITYALHSSAQGGWDVSDQKWRVQYYAPPTGTSYEYNNIYIPPDTLGIGKRGRDIDASGEWIIRPVDGYVGHIRTYEGRITSYNIYEIDSVIHDRGETYYQYWNKYHDEALNIDIWYSEAVWYEERLNETLTVGQSMIHMGERVGITLGTIRFYQKFLD